MAKVVVNASLSSPAFVRVPDKKKAAEDSCLHGLFWSVLYPSL